MINEMGLIRDAWERQKALSKAWFQTGLTDDDRDWLRHHFELMGEDPPAADISWISMEQIR